MTGKIILVTGGARSGKSAFAEEYAKKLGGKTAYIATAEIRDGEMRERIKNHQNRRPKEWTTYESLFDAGKTLECAARQHDAVLFDCLTLYTSNLLLKSDNPPDKELRRQYILSKTSELIKAARQGPAVTIFVTNEVGLGIVPENPLAREYRDIAGLVNQKVAGEADEVYLVVSGIAINIKTKQGENHG